MKVKRTGLLATALVAAAALAPASASGLAVSPGGGFTATGVTSVTVGTLPFTCTGTTVQGTVGAGGTGSVSIVSFRDCWGVFGAPTFVTTGMPSGLDVAHVEIARQPFVRWRMAGAVISMRPMGTCSLTASGPIDSMARADAYPLVQTTLPVDAHLVAGNLVGCGSLLRSGDPVTIRGDLALSPTQTITP